MMKVMVLVYVASHFLLSPRMMVTSQISFAMTHGYTNGMETIIWYHNIYKTMTNIQLFIN